MQAVRAEPDDEGTIRLLLSQAELPHEDLEPDHLEHFLVIREATGTVIGVIGLEPAGQDALLRSLAVSSTSRGQGLGKLLTASIEEHARELGVRRLYMLTTTADKFFDRFGYRRIPRESVPEAIASTREFASLCPSTAVCMVKELVPVEQEDEAGELVQVFKTADPALLPIVKSFLDAEGIPYIVAGGETLGLFPIPESGSGGLFGGALGAVIRVPSSHADRARDLLAQFN